MYIEEPKRKIDWGSLIKKGLIVLLIAGVIFLIIWLFTRNNSHSINVDYENNNNQNQNENIDENLPNPNSYSEIFINNYRYFHDTAKEYFLISELPSNGKTIKYTLQELIDKNLLLPFSYGESTCDSEASYVIVKNDNNKYTMTTTLLCENEIAQTTEELGCNQLCNNGVCETPEKTEILYQYKQPYKVTETTYSCPSGYTKTGSGSNTKCVKEIKDTVDAIKNVSTRCENGTTPVNGKCSTTATSYVDAKTKTETYCENGTTPVNGKCTITEDAKTKTETYCENGKTPNNGKCSTTASSYVNATVKYTCSKGTLVNEKYCRLDKSYYTTTETYKGKTYNGCTFSGSYTDSCSSYSNCTKTYYKYHCSKTSQVEATKTYTCSNGTTPSNGKCSTTSTSYVDAKTKTTTYCENGSNPVNGKCTTTVNAKTKTTTYCENGATPSNGKCAVSSNTSVNPITSSITYSCKDSSYIKTGSGANTKCVKTTKTTVEPTKSTKKVTKYKYKWSSETTLEGWTQTGKTKKASSK